MKYCKQCIMPDTRPGIEIGPDGICSACVGHMEKNKLINWEKRRAAFEELVAEARRREKGYDCIVPVSGGKDSTYQVVRCLEYRLRVLAVTWKTPARTPIGQKNLDNLVGLGVDHIDYAINPDVEKRFTYKALLTKGDSAIPMHMALYSIPLRLAVAYDIPLVVWGESPHLEYGGTEEERNINTLDMEWFKRHNILQGTSVEDWISEDLTRKDLEAYRLPSEQEFKSHGIRSVFLGYYFRWDPEENLRVALKHGFQVRAEGPRTGYYNYADIDCDFISVHHYFKWLKFGFTRLFDNLSVEIRNGRMSRDEALRIIAERGDQTPHEDIRKLCKFLNISEKHFQEIAESFRNKDIWSLENGRWVIKDFIIKDWKWQ
jgi:N-acetyl sugar amidotransferase